MRGQASRLIDDKNAVHLGIEKFGTLAIGELKILT
jgi:hypothetical protein